MQRLMGIAHPCGGAVFSSMLHRSPVKLRCADFVNVAVECEIGVRIAADLPSGRRYERDSIAEMVASCMASIEIVDDQNADYKLADGLNLVANNAWNAGVVIGPEVTDWRRLDLAALRGRMMITASRSGTASGPTCWAIRSMRWPGSPTRWPSAAGRCVPAW